MGEEGGGPSFSGKRELDEGQSELGSPELSGAENVGQARDPPPPPTHTPLPRRGADFKMGMSSPFQAVLEGQAGPEWQ